MGAQERGPPARVSSRSATRDVVFSVTCAMPGPAELSNTAKKRMKLIKQQAADMSSISKKKSSK